ncbi:CgeB family protein [Chryseobacterium geocarposphaerae]|uniref:Lipopolysaccharide biosynthesis protein n=1 Tax=Chryseobacterium geocarposphaerae TaxID=1416776 RepID=A0A2M9BY50_9FLAO|nr:lipopolysaccharide biosynthesis protein [Chryseobacterium geocarposphaerae]PJJ63007.1 hypothetical protein CLV73_3524 [Chryseobacterium geocarposphaerae]
MKNIKGKKVLFLAVRFFQYEKAIAQRLSELGAEVDFYDERPSNSNFAKGVIRFNKKIYQSIINRYYRSIIDEIQNKKYDYFLLIKGEAVPAYFLEKVRLLNPEIEMIYYNFDPLKEYPVLISNLKYFDKKFTFERNDALRYGLSFRPLFYLNEYKHLASDISDLNYDIIFIGSAHTDRYIVGENVRSIAEKLKLKCFFYYYAMGRIAFRLRKIVDKELKQFDNKKLSFTTLSHHEIIDYYRRAKSVLDINKPFQDGLTIRTFEVLASGRKLITTNSDITNYPFYNPNNIFIIDRTHIKLDRDFFNSEFEKIEDEVLYMMSLDSFIECLFVKDQNEYWNSFVKNNK